MSGPGTPAELDVRPGFERLLLATVLASTVGDEITQVALVFRVVPGGSGIDMAALLLCLLLPGAFVAPYAGKLVDERDAARVLAGASVLQAVVAAALAISAGPAAAIVGAACLSVLFAFSGAATFALLPILGRATGLSTARVNAAAEFASGGGAVLGPVIGGVLVAAGGVAFALAIDAATFLFLAVIVNVSKLRRNASGGTGDWYPAAVLSSYAPVLRHRAVLFFLMSLWVVVAALAVSDAVYAFLVTRVLALGPLAYGVFVSAWAVAYLLGAWKAGRWVQASPHMSAFVGGSAIAAAFLGIGLVVPFADRPFGAAVVGLGFLVGGVGNAVFNVAVRTVLHMDIPSELHGRAAALNGAGIRLGESAGFVTGGLLGPARVLTAYTLSGIAALLASLAGAASYAPAPSR